MKPHRAEESDSDKSNSIHYGIATHFYKVMDASRLLLLILVVVSTSEWAETAGPLCQDIYQVPCYLPEGEAILYSLPSLPHEKFTWYKNSSKIEYISSDKNERIHYHGAELFFLNLLPEDSGFYTARHISSSSGQCHNYNVRVQVFNASERSNPDYFYGEIANSDKNMLVSCPDPVTNTCQRFGGNFTWYKDFSLLQGNHEAELWVMNATKQDKGIYTCLCTWTYNHKVYNTSASRMLKIEAEPICQDIKEDTRNLPKGEAYHLKFVYYSLRGLPHEEFTWYKNSSKIEYISSDKNERIHYHGAELFFLNLLPEDSGFYTARHISSSSGQCRNYNVRVHVFNASERSNPDYFYGEIENSDKNMLVPCPDPVSDTCQRFGGNFTWYKDFSLLQGNHEAELWVMNATKQDEGIYTCLCTWTYNHKVYNTSASRMLKIEEEGIHRCEILFPTNKEQLADKGFGIKLNCSVLCGTNVGLDCHASWILPDRKDGYNQTTKLITEKPTKNTISTATLTIDKVSAKDFNYQFTCVGTCYFSEKTAYLTLKQRASITQLVIRAVCVLLFFVLVAVLVKCFAIDLALFFRSYFPISHYNKDTRLYDAYVVYQTQSIDKTTEITLSRFVTEVLPLVLEEKCGYRLFIHGRDDIPDRLELVEETIEQSRRLLVILTPGSESGTEFTNQSPASTENSVIGGFDWQVGLHHALIQRDMSVILIQVGDTGPQGYTHLPAGLQHLIRKSAPLRWTDGSRWAAASNSRFWKRVRYLMPARPAKKCSQSAII